MQRRSPLLEIQRRMQRVAAPPTSPRPPRYLPGVDITQSLAPLLVNTVNTVGVMGAGVAQAFRLRWPGIIPDYLAACRSGALQPGGCLLLPLPDGRHWAALATKQHWRDPSQEGWVESGLAELARLAGAARIGHIALPPPGCGHGGLDWRRVEPMVLAALAGFALDIHAATTRPG